MISPEILRRYPYFAEAKDEGLRSLAMIAEEVVVGAGTTMYREGDRTDTLYILVEGEVDIQYTMGSGQLLTVDTTVPGELLMFSALVEPHRSTAVVTARTKCRLVAFDADKLRAYCAQDHKVANDLLLHVTKLLAERLEWARIQLATIG